MLRAALALVLALVLASGVATAACRPTTTKRLGLPVLATVSTLDLAAYMGTWYEIARFDERFQRGCVASQATYSPAPDGGIEVVNACREGRLDGPWRRVRARGRRPDSRLPGRLEVNFFGPFWFDYWVLELGERPAYAVVGAPSRDHLWILARGRHLDAETTAGILERLRAVGFDPGRLLWTPQPDEAAD